MVKIFFLFIALFIQTTQINENPKILAEVPYPIVLSTNESNFYYIIAEGKSMKIEKESGNILEMSENEFNMLNYLYIVDNSNNNYLCSLNSNEYYKIIYDPIILYDKFLIDSNIGGFDIVRVGSLSENNNLIIYGYSNEDNSLVFISHPKYNIKSFEDSYNVITDLSCKLIENGDFICILINDKTMDNLIIYKWNYTIVSEEEEYFNFSYDIIQNHYFITSSRFDSLAMFNTQSNDIKLLCLQEAFKIQCKFFKINSDCILDLLGDNNILFSPSDYISEKNCYLTQFNSEYLLCCAFADLIKCFRINKNDYNPIKFFEVSIPGFNSYLTIKSNDEYAAFFFMNNNNDINSIYQYYIYLPNCQDKSYNISNNLNENKEETEYEKLSNLFTVKTNKYFFEIDNPNEEFGYFTLNGEKINQTTLIINNENILDFIVANNHISEINTKTFNYTVSVEDNEAYTKQCQITFNLISKSCYHSCENCFLDINESNEENHNCITCKKNFYFSPENKNNCYSIDEKKINWYYDSIKSEFGICHEECLSCSGPTELNCLSCFNGLYLDNLSCKLNCSGGYFPVKFNLGQGYYFECHKCNSNCKTCINDGDSQNMNCLTCKENYIKYNNNCYIIDDDSIKSFYVYEDDEFYSTNCYEKFRLYIKEDSNECIPLPFADEGYYISNNETGLLRKKNVTCHPNCKSCNREFNPTINEMNCLECIDDYFFIYGKNNCYDSTILQDNKYYFNTTDSKFHKCYNTCLECLNSEPDAENHFCLNCINEYYFLDNTNNCYSTNLIELGYYLESYIFKKCHISCKTCSNGYDSILDNHNCMECADNYYKLENGLYPNSCYDNETINAINNMKTTTSTQKIEFINPSESIFEDFDSKISLTEFKNQIKNDIVSYVNSSKVISGENFLAMISSSDNMNPENQIKNGISAVDLGNCTNIIKEYYNISKEESFIVLNIESKNDIQYITNNYDKSFILGKNSQIEIYDYSGRRLNLSVCQKEIKILKYLGDVDKNKLDLESAKIFSNQDIDVFDPEDDFFNDLCHNYNDLYGRDIIINDRRNDIYQNATFCQIGCEYNGIIFELNAADCLCNSNYLQEEGYNIASINSVIEVKFFKNISKVFLESLLDFNFGVLRCYNLVINTKILIHNIGFYCFSSMFFMQIIFAFVYLSKKLISLKNFMLKFQSKNTNKNKRNINIINNDNYKKLNNNKDPQNKLLSTPPIKKKYQLKSFNSINNNKQTIDNNKFPKHSNKKNIIQKNFEPRKIKEEPYNLLKPQLFKSKINSSGNLSISHNIENNINIQIPNIYKKNNVEKRNILSDKEGIFINKGKQIKLINKNNDNFYDIKSNKHTILKKNISNSRVKENSSKLLLTIYDLQDMDFEEAIIYDKRSCLKIYWGFLVDSQIILGTFCTDNHLDLFIIKLSFFICTFQISFFLNALFYTDEYISNAYHNDGILDFISGLPKSIYSFIATLITTNLLRMLSSSKSELMKLIKDKRKYENYLYLIQLKLAKLCKKLIIYFILVYLFSIFFWYYVFAFCAVYRNSQKYLFLGCLESFGTDCLVAFAICIFLSILRYISIRKKIKCFYILANIIGTFL